MNLHGYVIRLETILRSRQDFELNDMRLTLMSLGAVIVAKLTFYDGSQLSFTEQVEQVAPRQVERRAYKFHYQRADGTLVFRYDNSPHHPHLTTFPAHKHVGEQVIESPAPDLTEVLREIDKLLYPDADS